MTPTATTPAATTTTYDLAALDMAGTTVDEGGIVYRVLDATVSEAAGVPVPAELLARWKGTSKREAIAGLLTALGASADEPSVDKAFDDFTARLVTAYRETPPTPVDGVLEVFAELRARGVKIALQTGYSAEIADSILAGLGWTVGAGPDATVDAIVTSDLVPASRPAPYLVFRAMEATGVSDVRRVLVAGDTPNDLLSGIHAGAGFVVGVTTGSFDAIGLGATPHTHLLASCAELASLL